MQYSELPRPKQGGKYKKPDLDTREIMRREKLYAVLPHTRQFLDSVLGDRCRVMMTEAATPLIARAVAEIAVLDRETDARDDRVVITYSRLIAQALGFEDDPCRAIKLWIDAATVPLEQFGVAWAQHVEKAQRSSESRRHVHRRLVDLTELSVALNATRPRMREIFGVPKCALPPVKIRDNSFSPEERAMLRELAKSTGYTRKHLGELALNPESFCNVILACELELSETPPDTIDRNRTGLKGENDLDIARSIRSPKPWQRSQKPGPKTKTGTIENQIEAVARLHKRSPATIWAWRSNLKVAIEAGEIEAPEPISTRYGIKGVEISDPLLIQIAQVPWYKNRRKTYAHLYGDRDLIVRWHIATKGFEPKPATIRQWAKRGILAGYAASARLWADEIDLQAADTAEADKRARVFDHNRKATVSDEGSATRPVRPSEDHLDRGLPPAEALSAEGGDADVGF